MLLCFGKNYKMLYSKTRNYRWDYFVSFKLQVHMLLNDLGIQMNS